MRRNNGFLQTGNVISIARRGHVNIIPPARNIHITTEQFIATFSDIFETVKVKEIGIALSGVLMLAPVYLRQCLFDS